MARALYSLCILWTSVLPLVAQPIQDEPNSLVEANPTLDERVQGNLARHLEGESIGLWLAGLPADGLEAQAARWILAWLPLADCAAMDLAMLREHVEYAAKAYREAPWRDSLPFDLWLHFVVPHRVSQEPAQAWRRTIHEEIWPRVKDAQSMEWAALAVNRWCREQATFQSTSGRDQGPLTTVDRGIGRCEEEMILTICAMRSVGIPARSCSTPYWSFTDNNHAWVEVWADGRWWFLGGCEPDACLNKAWFAGSARRTGFVRSSGYGEFDPSPEPLYRAEDGSTVINSTAVYTDPIQVTAHLDAPWANGDSWIYANVVNFGSLRPIAKMRSGETLELGPGEYAFTAGDGEVLLLEVQGGASGESLEVWLDGDDAYDFEASPGFWLRYPETAARPARDLSLVTDLEQREMERRIRSRDGDRKKLRTLSEEEQARVEALSEMEGRRFRAALEKPFTHVSELVDLLEVYPEGEGRAALLAFLDAADDKDLLELDGADIRAHIDSALAMRTARGMEIPNVVFEEGLLPCRIEREPGRAWRADIEFLRKGETPRESLDACIQNWTTRIKEVEGGLFGPRLDPGQVWRLGLGTESDSKVGLVGYLRCQGFPARYSHGKVEAWVDEWLPVDMAAGRVQATAGEEGGTRGRLGLSITRGGATFEGAESYRHFNVARLQEGYLETPWWDPALGEQDWDVGAHILCSANRVPGGSIFARLRRFEVRKGETVRVTLPIDIGPGWDPGDRFFSGPDPAAFQSALAAAGLDRASSQFVFMAPAGEPCDRMLTSLEEVVDRLRAMESAPNLRFLFVGATAETPVPETLLDSLKTLGIESIESISEPTARALLGSETIDPLAGLRFGGEWIYLRAGFDTAVGSNLHWALDLSGR